MTKRVSEPVQIPHDTILFISGAPGAGKTSISYGILRRFDCFRIIEETDIMREIIRGYNAFAADYCRDERISEINMYDSTVIMSYSEALNQCRIIKNSIRNVVERQQRKKIPTIINGVHIVPKELIRTITSTSTVYINLYVSDFEILKKRLSLRNEEKYSMSNIGKIYEMNRKLEHSTREVAKEHPKHVFNIDTSFLEENRIVDMIKDTLADNNTANI